MPYAYGHCGWDEASAATRPPKRPARAACQHTGSEAIVPGGVSFAIKAPPFVTSTIRLAIVVVKAFTDSGANSLTPSLTIVTTLRTAICVNVDDGDVDQRKRRASVRVRQQAGSPSLR